MNYKNYLLKDLIIIKYGKNQKKVVSNVGQYPIYGTSGIIGFANKYLYNKPSILIGRKGNIDKVRYIEKPFWAVDTMFYTEIDSNKVLPKFLFYLMTILDLNKYNEGTTIPSLRLETLYSLKFKIPPLEIQKKIAKVLSTFDDKIELNNKINENLEQQAQAIFKSWFIDFEPFDGKMPSDWRIGILGELTEINSGRRPLVKSDIKINSINVPVIGATKIMAYTDAVLYNEKIIVTGRVGTHGVIQKINFPCWCSDNTLVIKTKYYEYVYQQLRLIDYDNLNRGSTQPLITSNDLKKVQIVIPNKSKINEFEKIILPLSKQQFDLQIENERLANLRDTLLPKLMNGEIDVDKI